MSRLLLADDHTLVRRTMRRSMEDEGFEIVAEAGDGEEAVRLAEELLPDVVLMDVSMPVLDGVEATRLIRERVPAVQVVMLTMHSDADVVRRALSAGAAGYLTKDCSLEDVVAALRLAAGDDVALSPELAGAMLREVVGPDGATHADAGGPGLVSPREAEVLQLIANGGSPAEVAEQLYISVKTVKNHLSSIYQKLEARDRTQAVIKAVRSGIIKLE